MSSESVSKNTGSESYVFQDIMEQSLRGTVANSTRPFFKVAIYT